MKRILALIVLALFMLPTLGIATHAAAQAEKGPATDRIIWKSVSLDKVAAALETGDIDVYLFSLRPAAAQELTGKPGIKLYQAPSGLVDIGLNPAPVMIVTLPGKLDKKAAAEKLGVDPVVIAYATYVAPDSEKLPPIGVPIEDKDVTVVELCAKPLGGLPTDAKVVWESDKFDINPFCFREIRFALNYIVDRDYIVKNIYKGFAIPKYTFYGPDDPTYTVLIDIVAKYKFSYNPEYAKSIVSNVLSKAGAEMKGGTWYYNGKPITVIGIIRQEDERLDIGNLFANELENTLGIKVQRQILPFGEAIPKVYFTDPKDFEWSFYTEGWGKGALDRWDPWMLAQFAAAWLGWSPGWGEADFWNYRNDTIDSYSKPAALGEVKSKEQFIEYLRKGTELGIQESIRIWIAAIMSSFPARADVKGVTLDLGSGLRNPFMYRGMYVPGSDTVKVGHLHVFTAATIWNPLGGFDDVYSVDPARATYDPSIWRHPFNGEPIPFRVEFSVETAGPDGKMKVPDDAIWWDAENDRWVYAKDLGRTEAVSKVVFDLSKLVGSKWHDGEEITYADILAWLAENIDIVYDPVKSQIESSIAGPAKESFDKIVAYRLLPDQNKLEVYLDYWHFDPNYIADFAAFTLYNPTPIVLAMDYLAFVKKTFALSDTRSEKENIPQLNLVLKDHAEAIAAALDEISYDQYKGYFTLPDGTVLMTKDEWNARIQAAKSWISQYGNAWISDGPFKLVRFDKDAQVLELEAFRDPTYPFGPTDWVFGLPTPTTITNVVVPLVEPGRPARITVTASGLPPIHVKYILRDPATGKVLATGEAQQAAAGYVIELSADLTSKLEEYAAYELAVIAYSEQVALPAEKTVVLQTTAAATQQIGELQQALQQTQEQVQALQEQLQQQVQALQQVQQQVQQLQQALGRQLAEAITGLSKQTADAIATVGQQVQALGDAVAQLGQKIDEISQLLAQLQNVATKADVNKAATAAQQAQSAADKAYSKANLAVTISIINLILLLVLIGLTFTRRQQ
ncbi:hypothetical protein Pyrde_1554 [Pyrodictium delaneyi]|uniref:Solute-binding protein family 5 domain-containing protein n=1 Tax=Pyrodictium delaneyi TaxID=1273541 RepID=A0A0P0N3U6_9CREN|nr:ABC transporter substrate-binding protein [Pyrodictium delaneyi]ALL01597.1 hypothetical protein Pyrde_1554 [Pyrodictium delaneyi]